MPDASLEPQPPHPVPTNSTGNIWDRTLFMAQIENDHDIAESIIKEFIHATPRLLGNIEEAVTNRDLKAITLHAHSAKGAAAIIAAGSLKLRASEIEAAAKEGNLESIRVQLTQLSSEFTLLKEILDKR